VARRIIDGAKRVSIFGEDIPIRAHIYTIKLGRKRSGRNRIRATHPGNRSGGPSKIICVADLWPPPPPSETDKKTLRKRIY
jgi:hypothetical protein